LDLIEGAVDDALGDGLLARFHDDVHELGQVDRAELGVGEDVPLGDFATTRHFTLPFASVGARFANAGAATGPPTYSTARGPPQRPEPGTEPGIRSNSGPEWPRWIEKALSLLRALGAVLRARLLAVFDALQVERTAHDVIAHARQVLDAAAAHEHDAVLLQVVAFAADVGNDLEAVREAHLGDLAQRRVRLLRGRGVDACADAAALRPALQRRRLRLDGLGLAAVADELVDRGHRTRFVARRTTPLKI